MSPKGRVGVREEGPNGSRGYVRHAPRRPSPQLLTRGNTERLALGLVEGMRARLCPGSAHPNRRMLATKNHFIKGTRLVSSENIRGRSPGRSFRDQRTPKSRRRRGR
jgi:hypothetical protein